MQIVRSSRASRLGAGRRWACLIGGQWLLARTPPDTSTPPANDHPRCATLLSTVNSWPPHRRTLPVMRHSRNWPSRPSLSAIHRPLAVKRVKTRSAPPQAWPPTSQAKAASRYLAIHKRYRLRSESKLLRQVRKRRVLGFWNPLRLSCSAMANRVMLLALLRRSDNGIANCDAVASHRCELKWGLSTKNRHNDRSKELTPQQP